MSGKTKNELTATGLKQYQPPAQNIGRNLILVKFDLA